MLVFLLAFLSCGDAPGAENAAPAKKIAEKNGYSFSAGNDFYDFNSDYKGVLALSDSQLERIYRQLSRRALALSNSGTVYLIAVIPMAQTVYDRYLPSSYTKDRTSLTRLEQLERYIDDKNIGNENRILFCNLTDAFRSVSENTGLYDKTDGSLTPEGGYYAYSGIFNFLPSDITGKNKLIESPSDAKSGIYAVVGNESTILSTYVKIEHRDSIPTNPSLLADCGDRSDLDALLPYFSSTFGGMGYRLDYEYSLSALDAIAPKAVIQVYREDMLHLLWDDVISLSYENGLKPGDDPYRTMKPQVLDTVMTGRDVACIMGTVEAGSLITVAGENFETYTETAQNERFFIDVKIPKNGSETVRLSAKAEGKEESAISEVVLEYDEGAENRTVFTGRMSQLHYPYTLEDYYGSNLFSEKELLRISKVIDNRLKSVRKASGKNTKLVYLIAPNSLTIYPETATDEMISKKVSDDSRLRQFVALINTRDDGNVLIIDLADTMKAGKESGKLYYQTDTHWNTLGAYFGYYGLMSAINRDCGIKGTAPYELDLFNITQSNRSSGDLCNFLGIDNSIVSEYVTHCSPAFPLTAVRDTDFIGSEVMRTGDSTLPEAVVMRDSFGAALIGFVSEHFSEITFMPPGTGVNTDVLKAVSPDYFIQVLVERNLSSLLG